ncbi:hypothetical protein K2X92_01210 [Candidatus Gracilibacteria bacterium]|nr:hypothetical protein [Candidatus Gracilibacteria bacterium]
MNRSRSLNTRFALHGMAMALASASITSVRAFSTEPGLHGTYMSNGNDDAGGGGGSDPALGADTVVKTDVADPAAGAVNTEDGENTGSTPPEGGAVVEGDGTNNAGAVLEEAAGAVVTEGGDKAADA